MVTRSPAVALSHGHFTALMSDSRVKGLMSDSRVKVLMSDSRVKGLMSRLSSLLFRAQNP